MGCDWMKWDRRGYRWILGLALGLGLEIVDNVVDSVRFGNGNRIRLEY
jgi:hypothetical protein